MYPTLINDKQSGGAARNPAFLQARNDRDGFLRYFGFRQSPFGVTPDPGFLFFSRLHRAALDAMIQSIESNLGFTVLLGGPGTGKTTLLFQLLTQYRDCARTAFIFQTQCKPHDLLRCVASEFELPAAKHDEVLLHQRLKRMLVKEARAGRKVLIIIDEAQNLQPSSLEAIRLLSDFETAPAKLMHVVLAGSSRLGETLLAPELSQLAQRVFTVCRLEPLSAEEVKAYVNFRLGIAGSRVVEGLFSPESFVEIANRSGGVPRLVNSICYQALWLAYRGGQRHVSRAVVQQAAQDLDLSESSNTNLSTANQWPKATDQEGWTPPSDINSGECEAARDPYTSDAELPRNQCDSAIESQPGVAGAVVNGSEERHESQAYDGTSPVSCYKEGTLAQSGGLHHHSGERMGILKPQGFRSATLKNDPSTLLLAALILLALGLLTAWHALRIKSSQSMSIQPNIIAPVSKDQNNNAAAVSQPGIPITTAESNARPTGPKLIGAAPRRTGAPVVETLPDTLLPSKISRPPASSTEPNVSSNAANVSINSDFLPLPLTNAPPSVPRLSEPVATNQPPSVAPAPSLHPTKVVRPEYPKLAKLRHIEGEVVLELEIDSSGNVENVRTVSGNGMLTEAAEQAVWQWHYPSFPRDQFPVPAVTQVRFNFRLNPDTKR